jgi:phosphoglycerol transferase MdoB-like AlkP superfamily enzyme
MKGHLLFLLRLLLFWLILFTFQRLLFVFYFLGEFSGHVGDLLLMPFYALRLDFAGFSYIMGLPFLVSVSAFFMRSEKGIKVVNLLISVFVWTMVIAASVIAAGEIVSYYEWQTKLSSKIWIHFTTPSEIFRTGSGSNTWYFLAYFVLQLIFAWVLYVRVFKKNRLTVVDASIGKRIGGALIYFVCGTALLGLGVRGGWQEIPVSATNAYHSEKRIVNDVTVNPVWNFIHMTYTFLKVDLDHYFTNLSVEESEQIKNEVYAVPPGADTISVFTDTRPNIVLVTLEGWSAQLIEPLGGEKDITPNFNALCNEGLLFTRIYSTGGTSETGHSSIISGYPTISGISISTESAKCRKLPGINQSLEAVGYSTFYTFGGALSYGNIGGYLSDVGFDRLVDENDLDLEPTGQLGIHDEAMFPYFLSEIQSAKRPYFYGLFTQSTHAPYDMPAPPYPGYDGDGYVTSMHYADEHLGKFVEGIRKLPDFENTIVIFIADHGKSNLFNPDTYDEKFFHIPLLIWGGALKPEYRGSQIDKIGSQADLAKTLLNQMELNSGEYHWSKDLLNANTPEWAICTSTLSYGWKDSSGYTVYQMIEDHLIYSAYDDPEKTDLVLKKCRSVLECMYREFKEL